MSETNCRIAVISSRHLNILLLTCVLTTIEACRPPHNNEIEKNDLERPKESLERESTQGSQPTKENLWEAKIMDDWLTPEGATIETVCLIDRAEVRKYAAGERALQDELRRLASEELVLRLTGPIVRELFRVKESATNEVRQHDIEVKNADLSRLLDNGIAIETRRIQKDRVDVIARAKLTKRGFIEEKQGKE